MPHLNCLDFRGNHGVNRDQDNHNEKASKRTGPQFLPQEVQCESDADRGSPEEVQKVWSVLKNLRIDRHEVHHLTNRGVLLRAAGKLQSLQRTKAEIEK